MNQLGLFDTPAERAVLKLPDELQEVLELARLRWGGMECSRVAWINYLGICRAEQPEDALGDLLACGVLIVAGSDQYQLSE